MHNNKPIGVFDSGLGGLTVMKAILDLLPDEEIVYFGDTARVPYGAKTAETVVKFTDECVRFLKNQDVKMIVLACNTASASAVEYLRATYDIPIVEVIYPGSLAAVKRSQTGHIAVIGTERTISSAAYQRAIETLKPGVTVSQLACPMFVPLVEEGWLHNEVTKLTIERYLKPWVTSPIDTLVLGCTHYPLLKKAIQEILGDGVTLVDSAEETARQVEIILQEKAMERRCKTSPHHRFYVTDAPERFKTIGEAFLGETITDIQKTEL